MRLDGKTALVTGASTGLGKQMCRCLAAAGARVILASRSLEQLEIFAKELGNALPLRMDVADKVSVKNAFEYLEQKKERIDICINNAAASRCATAIFEVEENDELEQMFQTNVFGVWYVTKYVAIHMKKHEIHGSIINIGSVSGEQVLGPTMAAYSASKAAVRQMTKALTGELADYNIRINCVQPGLFITEKNKEGRMAIIEDKPLLKSLIPLNFVAEPKELDGIILFLSSNLTSKYVTGACFNIDGGTSWGGK